MLELAERVTEGERRALAKAITLIESSRSEDQDAATSLLDALRPPDRPSLRIGVSGPPGVGKSTFIEAIGLHIIGQGRKIAVLSIDPSSRLSGGSILGDKTRMENLARHSAAFIRPTPAGTAVGGVGRRTRETMVLCEAAGFDVVFVETIGVGQSEVAVAGMTDVFLVLLLPQSGDELQGIKRGIMELADIVLVNKADGGQLASASRTVADYRNALGLLRPRARCWAPVVEACSALKGEGIELAWSQVLAHRKAMEEDGMLEARRSEQAHTWMWEEVNEQLKTWLSLDESAAEELAACEKLVVSGELSPPMAARRVLRRALRS